MKKIKFRERIAKSGNLFLAGRDAGNNEELVKQVKKDEIVLHTVEPGSPFINIKGIPNKGDIKEAAIFCAEYSKDWKKNGGDIMVHRFKGEDIYKEKGMKKGTFGVKKSKRIKVREEWILEFE